MNKKAKVKLKETILKEIEKLKEDIATYKDITKPIAPDNAIGRLTRMDAIGRKHIKTFNLKLSVEIVKNNSFIFYPYMIHKV